jgi:hypothetical protein
MLHGSMDFEKPPSRLSVIELPGSDIQKEGYLKKLKVKVYVQLIKFIECVGKYRY